MDRASVEVVLVICQARVQIRAQTLGALVRGQEGVFERWVVSVAAQRRRCRGLGGAVHRGRGPRGGEVPVVVPFVVVMRG
jgi:hypothetical protein